MKTHIEIPVTVEYDYQPEERQTQTDPAWPEGVIITSVKLGKLELLNDLPAGFITSVESEALEHIHATSYADKEL